jgi:hypothetical protein
VRVGEPAIFGSRDRDKLIRATPLLLPLYSFPGIARKIGLTLQRQLNQEKRGNMNTKGRVSSMEQQGWGEEMEAPEGGTAGDSGSGSRDSRKRPNTFDDRKGDTYEDPTGTGPAPYLRTTMTKSGMDLEETLFATAKATEYALAQVRELQNSAWRTVAVRTTS